MSARPTDPGRPAARGRLTAEQRRAHIVASARTVFAERGLAGARTKDLAAAAGVNEAMLYRHFASKEELFEAAVGQPLEEAVSGLVRSAGRPPEEYSPSASTQREQTRQFIYELCEVMDDTSQLLGVAMFGQADAAQHFFEERIAPTLAAIEEVLRANYHAWPHRPFDPAVVVRSLFGMTWFTAIADRHAGITRDRDELADQLTEIFLDGLMTPDPEAGE